MISYYVITNIQPVFNSDHKATKDWQKGIFILDRSASQIFRSSYEIECVILHAKHKVDT